MELVVWTYFTYLILSVLLTVWVAQTLHKNGRVFLVDVFRREDLADSVNHLLVVGFYLINLGYVTFALKMRGEIASLRYGVEALSVKIGGVLLVLGIMHFFNLYIFSRMRKRSLLYSQLPPVEPDETLAAAAKSAR